MSIKSKNLLFRMVCYTLAIMLVTSYGEAAVASSKAGAAIDIILSNLDEFATEILAQIYDVNDVTISKDEVFGKSGTIYLNFDENKTWLIGETGYRTYEFADEDFFKMFAATICMIIDYHDVLDYGVHVYWVSNHKTEQVSEDEIRQVAAQMTTLLN